jgi:hypothetical protein
MDDSVNMHVLLSIRGARIKNLRRNQSRFIRRLIVSFPLTVIWPLGFDRLKLSSTLPKSMTINLD